MPYGALKNHEYYSEDPNVQGTVAREKLFNWGLEKMVWTIIIDLTWVLHFSEQLFNCHNI